MKIAILFDEISPQDVLDDKDVLEQVRIVIHSLIELGHEYVLIPCTLNLQAVKEKLINEKPDLVFNLLDTLDSKDSLQYLPVELVESMNIPHTGPRAIPLAITTRKKMVRSILGEKGLPVAKAIQTELKCLHQTTLNDISGLWIIKDTQGDGSFGMDDKSVVDGNANKILALLTEYQHKYGREAFAEEYLDGREFTVPFLCGKMLPVIEILYNNYPDGKPKILGQKAKWKPESFEYQNTGMTFPSDFPSIGLDDNALKQLANKCVGIFDLSGWGRIDFRTKNDGNDIYYIIDVNANSSLSPNAWFAQAIERVALTMTDTIQEIIKESLR